MCKRGNRRSRRVSHQRTRMYVNHYNRVDYNFGAVVNINEPMEVISDEANEVEDVAMPVGDSMDGENTQTNEEVKIVEEQPIPSESFSYLVKNSASRKSFMDIKIGLVAAAVIGTLLFIRLKK